MSRVSRALGILIVLALASSSGCANKKAMRVKNWDPKVGPVEGGGTVNITGEGFQTGGAKGVRAYFGEREAKVLAWIGDDTLKVEAPAGEKDKTVDISLQFDDAKSITIEKAYTYQDVGQGMTVDGLTKKPGEGGQATPTPPPGGEPAPAPAPAPAPGGAAPPPAPGAAPSPAPGAAPAPAPAPPPK